MYHVLECFSPAGGYMARVEYKKDSLFRLWNAGKPMKTEPPLPVRATVISDRQTMYVEYWDSPLPLMTKRLHSALLAAGVSNLDIYPVVLTDSLTGTERDDYVAFNIIGLIAAADMQVTQFVPGSEKMISADIDSLVIDENKARGALMFRLAEAVNAIIVHDSVKQAIEAAGIDTLSFLPPEKVAL
jgi:hypothetical protein